MLFDFIVVEIEDGIVDEDVFVFGDFWMKVGVEFDECCNVIVDV